MTESVPDRRRGLRPLVLAGLVGGVVLTAVVLFWFQPQRLFIDTQVDEAVPRAEAPASDTGSTGAPASDAPQSTAPTELAGGTFVSLDHPTRGTVRVLKTGTTNRVIRLEGFETDNGPDLYLYVTANPADGHEGGFDDEFVNLGRLKGNEGDQNYELPATADLERLGTVVIWCDRFNSAFGAADLSEV